MCFYCTDAGNRVVEDELDKLVPAARAKILSRLELFARRSPIVKAEKVTDDVIEIKARVGNVQPRALVSVIGDHDDAVLVLRCLAKKERALKRSDIDLAEQRLADWQARSGA